MGAPPKQTILIVEDNEKNRALVRDILEYHGYNVIEAENGEGAVRKAKEHRPAMIIMDIQMPVLDGIGAAKIIKHDPEIKDIPMIALTSFAMKGDKERFLQAGFDDYVAKPIDTRMLPKLVNSYLRRGDPAAMAG